jgi:hypothetical protein
VATSGAAAEKEPTFSHARQRSAYISRASSHENGAESALRRQEIVCVQQVEHSNGLQDREFSRLQLGRRVNSRGNAQPLAPVAGAGEAMSEYSAHIVIEVC